MNKGIGNFFSLILILLAIFVFANLASRWVGVSLPWLFSGSIVILLAFAFLTGAYALGEGKHVTIDAVTSRLSENSRVSLEILGLIVCLAFSVNLGWEGATWVIRSYVGGVSLRGDIALSTFPADQWMVAAVVPVGSLLLILQSLRLIVKRTYFLAKHHVTLRTSLFPPVLVIVLFVLCILISVNFNPLLGLFLGLLVLFFGGTPVAFALGIVGTIGLYLFAGGAKGLLQVPISAFGSMESFPTVAFPLFIIIGAVMGRAGLAEALSAFTEAWFGRVRGSMLIVTIISGAIICAITGSSLAATALLSMIYMPVLLKSNYDPRLSAGTIAGASVGTLIPPSMSLLLFAIITETSLSGLFMAALVPALITFSTYGIYVLILSFTNKEKFGKPPAPVAMGEKLKRTRTATPILLLPVIILGGIYIGLFTATEAAAVAVVYGLVTTLFVSRTLSLEGTRKACLEGGYLSSMALFILIGGLLFSNVVSQLQIGPTLVELTEAIGLTRPILVLVMSIVLLFLGMFMTPGPIFFITLPLFVPLAMATGINFLWLGVFYTYMVEIGLLTPPVGTNLYVIQGTSGLPFWDCVRGIMPFLGILVLGVVVIYFFPVLTTWLPSTMISR